MSTAEVSIAIRPGNLPDDKVTVEIGEARITIPARQLVRRLLDDIFEGRPPSTLKAPRIGTYWPGQGGIYRGIARGPDGAPDYHVIEHKDERVGIAWQPAMDWAQGLEADGHRDFALPRRPEQSLQFANGKGEFAEEAYWSCEQCAGNESYAWYQDFGDGFQIITHKDLRLRARAVRRIPIQ